MKFKSILFHSQRAVIHFWSFNNKFFDTQISSFLAFSWLQFFLILFDAPGMSPDSPASLHIPRLVIYKLYDSEQFENILSS